MERLLHRRFSNHIRTSLVLFMLVMLFYSFISCNAKAGNYPVEPVSAQRPLEIRELKEGLKFVIRNIDHKRGKLRTVRDDHSAKEENKISAEDSVLHSYRIRAWESMTDLRTVDNENWDEISAKAKRVLNETKAFFRNTAVSGE